MDNNNTRRYPRTMNEAFPGSTRYACAIEVHRRDLKVGRIVLYATLIAAYLAIACVVSA